MRDTTANLFAPADRGDYTLPPALLATREGIRRLHAEPMPDVVTDLDERARLIQETADAAIDGGPLPDTSAIQAARANATQANDRQQVTVAAAEALQHRLNAAVAAAADTIITEHLRPAFDTVITELTDTLAITAEYDDDPRAALNASTKVRAAFTALPALYDRLDVLRTARRVIEMSGAPRPVKDETGEFVAVRNIDELWPAETRQYVKQPWPAGPDGTAWLIRHGAVLWLPTATEQDTRWVEVYGERDAAMRANAHAAAGVRSIA